MQTTIECSGRVRVPLSPDAAIHLFTPEGERDWVAGWDPTYPAGADLAPGLVFETGPTTTWVCRTTARACSPPSTRSWAELSAAAGAAPRLVGAATAAALAPRPGFEPGAYSLGGSRSIQLSYRGPAGIVVRTSKRTPRYA